MPESKGGKSATNIHDLMKSNRASGGQPGAADSQEDGAKKGAQKRERKQTSYNADLKIWEDAMLIADYLQMDKGEAMDTALKLFIEKYPTILDQAKERQRLAEALKQARDL